MSQPSASELAGREETHDAHLSDVDSSVLLAEGVSVSQFRDDRYGVQTGVFGKGGGDDFQSIGVCLEAVSLHSLQRV